METRDVRLTVAQIEFLIDKLEQGIRPNEKLIALLTDALQLEK